MELRGVDLITLLSNLFDYTDGVQVIVFYRFAQSQVDILLVLGLRIVMVCVNDLHLYALTFELSYQRLMLLCMRTISGKLLRCGLADALLRVLRNRLL